MERARWWIGAGLGVGIVMQCHVLGMILLPPVVALWLADVRRTGGDRRAWVVRAGLLGAVVIALMYVPLVIHELTHSFAETQAIAGWVASGGGPGPSLLERLPIVTWRVLAWPLAALITDRPIVAMLSAVLVILAIAACWAVYRGPQRVAVRWLTGTLVWSILALVVAAPSLRRSSRASPTTTTTPSSTRSSTSCWPSRSRRCCHRRSPSRRCARRTAPAVR